MQYKLLKEAALQSLVEEDGSINRRDPSQYTSYELFNHIKMEGDWEREHGIRSLADPEGFLPISKQTAYEELAKRAKSGDPEAMKLWRYIVPKSKLWMCAEPHRFSLPID